MNRYTLVVLLSYAMSNISAEQIIVNVKGIVCSFCASTIKKSFKKNGFNGDVKVDLDNQKVILKSKRSISMENKKIEKIILDSGYNIGSIQRNK